MYLIYQMKVDGSTIKQLNIKSTKKYSHRYYNDSGDFFMKVKLFDESHELDLEKSINKFLSENEIELLDIKYQVALNICGEEQIYCFSALLIYR